MGFLLRQIPLRLAYRLPERMDPPRTAAGPPTGNQLEHSMSFFIHTCLFLLLSALLTNAHASPPRPVIFDTDMAIDD